MYNVILHGSRATCPECAGTMTKAGMKLEWKCMDCKGRFKAVEQGITENEMYCERIVFEQAGQAAAGA